MQKKIVRIVCLFVVFAAGCSKQVEQSDVYKLYPLDDTSGLITVSGVRIDKNISSDGRGSLEITATEPTTIRLYELSFPEMENVRLSYQAKVRTRDVKGQVYLEMWCHFPGMGEFFSRGLQSPLTGSNEWTTEEIPFFIKKGEKADRLKLNIVVNGSGTVWVDDIRLLKGPLPQ